SKITAFLVTPDMSGFEVVEERMEKASIRGTATGRLAFHDMRVPAENILGPLGKGLRVALTVLDFGRTTFGASCTGVAKECLRLATEHALRRRQFGRPLADLELVKKKLAFLAATAYAMEATTYETAALIDRGADEYMLETAILKVFATDELWQGVYETMQIHGGSSFFTDKPLERMMRDARLNTVGEGSNEVLKAFIALVGMRDVGEGLKATLGGLKNPLKTLPTLWRFGSTRVHRAFTTPHVPVVSDALRPRAHELGKRVRSFAWAVERSLMKHREAILEMQYVQERIADAAIALVTSACTLARIDRALSNGSATDLDRASADLYLRTAARKFDRCLHDLSHNDDARTTETALAAMRTFG
ncbi:MAG TPA: acyl-CoA dehydrogenase family protein, partial [Isosphaeraceae bacterium]